MLLSARSHRLRASLLITSCLAALPLAAHAQDTAPAPASDDAIANEIVVVGSQIKNLKTAGELPVSVVSDDDISAIAPTSAADLLQALPANGTMNFNGTDTVSGGVHSARGDVASVNLRSIGSGNTLVLLNGRRLVQHPGTQTEDSVPVSTVNMNTLPVRGIKRMEVLHDGASAIYGSDAVAGVINTVLDDSFEGLRVGGELGFAENTDKMKYSADLQGGWTFNEGRTHLSLALSYYEATKVWASELDYAGASDRRGFVADTPFAGDLSFDNRSSSTPWGQFTAANAVPGLTSSGGVFHIQPGSMAGCSGALSDGLCIADGSLQRDLRYDINSSRTMSPGIKRGNAFAFITHDFGDFEFYSELSYYRARTDEYRGESSILSSARFNISRDAYWNPLGAAGNPNRVSGFDIPEEGVDLTLTNYRVVDAGLRHIRVDNDSFRLLGGFRGAWGNWDWDTAGLYSEATTKDVTFDRISNTLFSQALNRTDASGYNPFNGGDLANPNWGDASINSPETIDSFLVDVSRYAKTTLALADFKVSNGSLLSLPGGDVGIALGVEWRRTSFSEDYDDRLDGTTNFIDAVTGEMINQSDIMGSSVAGDASGSRNVYSAFTELAVPLVSRDMDVPLVRALNLQLAGRFEHYSDVGSVFRPKFAASWYPFDQLQIRGSYAEGFRAPNLEQLNTDVTTRVSTVIDYYACQASVNKGDIASLGACAGNDRVEERRFGNTQLKPEKNASYSIGAVFTPTPRWTLTVDYWHIKQRNLVGIFGAENIAALDYVSRLQGNGGLSGVHRADPTADDIAFYQGSGLDPLGEMVQIDDLFTNLDSRTSAGIDFGLYYQPPETPLGSFDIKFNASYLDKAYQGLSPQAQQIQSVLGAEVPLEAVGDLIERDGRPKWQASGTLTWKKDGWAAGLFGRYVGSYYDTGVVQDETNAYWKVNDWFTMNAYLQHTFQEGALSGSRVRFGVRNLLDSKPPFLDATYGYDASLASAEGRFFYTSIQASF
ncbi:TonB-dependent receptor domain-containing protein [Novosphingobium decolorationis]|uniref:TonB-dependent receptor n=1 Tax=Novosphingobium decolorationis TaxID=2698673 RepID=A0ABX8EAT6_9SPHN|nr:TonB-dependent receptor [Novosphingobium decolorationis]QVM85310.1 TonB-dependent receptor [Novosphingobium decolorationis]